MNVGKDADAGVTIRHNPSCNNSRGVPELLARD